MKNFIKKPLVLLGLWFILIALVFLAARELPGATFHSFPVFITTNADGGMIIEVVIYSHQF